MKRFVFILIFMGAIGFSKSQSVFDLDSYANFLANHQNMLYDDLDQLFPLKQDYYKGINMGFSNWKYQYLDSINEKYELTSDELALIDKNHFMVTERLSFSDFGKAFYDVYAKDLPVFISTDAILHALHMSYDAILKQLERNYLLGNLDTLTESLYTHFPQLEALYQSNPELAQSLKDVDLYVTVSRSLLQDSLLTSNLDQGTTLSEVWDAITAENYASMPLFTDTTRDIDFSQFTVRGHYVDDNEVLYGGQPSLEPYFRTMMWLGRIDFWLTSPQAIPYPEADIKRMATDALLLNQLIDLTGNRHLLNKNNEIIDYLVGTSDNLTPTQLSGITQSLGLDAESLLNSGNLALLQDTLKRNSVFGQKILSDILMMDPYSSNPDTLPISFKLMGQRFIIDSYVFSNVVYDRIIFNGAKIWRPMPDPLDALFVLGNENALPLLKDEIDTYHYSMQLGALRYLVDAYGNDFWNSSLYNTWLNSIRDLKVPDNYSNYPIFMQSAGWQQEKMNTQLASWTQLRHDNLLYAKPSYTGGTSCSYPYSFVEPNPAFYEHLKTFAENAASFFSSLPLTYWYPDPEGFFSNFAITMDKLKVISEKELDKESFTSDEIEFLKTMLYKQMECGPPFNGWYAGLFFNDVDVVKPDYLIADIHTQPTDQFGEMVGNVLHVGTGNINLGVFLAQSPSKDNENIAFVGPVFSYYEKTTTSFLRLTDEAWSDSISTDQIPLRPDWVNCYLADQNGTNYVQGREIEGIPYVGIPEIKNQENWISQLSLYPNPVNETTKIRFKIEQKTALRVEIVDQKGRIVAVLSNRTFLPGVYNIDADMNQLKQGVYLCKISSTNEVHTIKLIK